MVIVCRFL